jgi:hypothetical protein
MTSVDPETGSEISVYVATLIDEALGRAVVLIGMTPADEAEAYLPVFPQIANTVVLREPELGGLTGGEITGGETADFETVGFVLPGETVEGTVAAEGNSVWEYIGLEGEVIDIVVTPDEELDAVVDMVDSSGVSILSFGEVDSSFGEEEVLGVAIPSGGTYYIVIRGFAGGGGDYTMSVTEAGSAGSGGTGSGLLDGETISLGDTVSGAVVAGSTANSVWEYNGLEGEVIDIVVTPDEELDAVVDMVDSSGFSILPSGEVDSSFGEEEVLGVDIPSTGAYYIVIRGFAGGGGDYTLSVTESGSGGTGSGPVDGETLSFGDTVSGEVASGGTSSWSFVVESVPSIDLFVGAVIVPDGDFDAVIDVLDSNGNSVLYSSPRDASFGMENVLIPLAEPDVYTIQVTEFSGVAGSYELTLGYPMANLVYASDELTDDNIDEGHAFPFEVWVAGEMVGILVEPADNLDVAVQVRQDGELMEELGWTAERGFDSSVGGEAMVFIAPDVDVYSFRVKNSEDDLGDNTGAYDVLLVGSSATVFELTFGDTVAAMTNVDGFVEYVISGLPGDVLELELESADSDMDFVLELEDLDGNLLVGPVDETTAGNGELLSYTFESEELIVIRVREYFGDEGGFFLNVSLAQ